MPGFERTSRTQHLVMAVVLVMELRMATTARPYSLPCRRRFLASHHASHCIPWLGPLMWIITGNLLAFIAIWLREAGFEIGTGVTVKISEGGLFLIA